MVIRPSTLADLAMMEPIELVTRMFWKEVCFPPRTLTDSEVAGVAPSTRISKALVLLEVLPMKTTLPVPGPRRDTLTGSVR